MTHHTQFMMGHIIVMDNIMVILSIIMERILYILIQQHQDGVCLQI